MDGAEVGVLEEADEVSLSGLLESENRRALEAEVSLELLGNLANQALERELADEELSGLLVSPDLAESDGAWAVPVGLLDASRSGSVLSGCLGGELLTRGLASCGFAGSLLCAGLEENRVIGEKLKERQWIDDCLLVEGFTREG